MTFTDTEKQLLIDILLRAYANGNTVTPKPFDPTPEQWKTICSILNKLRW